MPDDPFLQAPNVGRCRLIARVGEGGMGVVYRGWHEDLDLAVAVKFLNPDQVAKGHGADRFLREARLAARLNHPGIVRVFDCGESDGRYFIVMEFVDGQSLEAHIAERQAMGVDRSLQVAEEVAKALGEAWSQVGVIHRDVKPANILLTSAGQVKLADLGLAKVAAGAGADAEADTDADSGATMAFSARTEAGTSLGTPAYMPPEQFLDASAVDLRADVYALGATLYHMLAGRPPFRADSVFGLLRLIEREDPPPLPDHVPLAVEQLVAKMMAKKPADRHQTHAELIEDLRAAQRPEAEASPASMLRSSSSRTSITTSGIIPAARTAGRAVHSATPKENRVLLVVDVQNDFCPGGALAVPGGDELPKVINKLSRRFSHVVLTQDWHPEDHLSFASSHPGEKPFGTIELPYGPQILWPDHCIQDEPGSEFHPELEVRNCELIIRKGYLREIDSYSAFFENDRSTPTGLAGYLRERGLNRLFVVGLATDFCVAYSALDARRLGFEVTVIESACRGIDLDGSLEAAWKQMEEAGVVRA